MARPKIYYKVLVQRTTVATAVFTVKAKSSNEAQTKAVVAANADKSRFASKSTSYHVCVPEICIELDTEIPSAMDAYREYLVEAAGDWDFDLATVVTYEEWKREYLVKSLLSRLTTYGADKQALFKLVRNQKRLETDRMQTDLSAQVSYLVETCGYTQTRALLNNLLRLEQQDWPEGQPSTEEENESDDL